MNEQFSEADLPANPQQWVKDLEAIWQAMDPIKATHGFTEDAVLYYGAGQSQSGEAMRARPAKWFAYASDLRIHKKYISHSGNCIVTSWDSEYTDPESGKKMRERGIEYFKFRSGKICEQHAWQHSWAEGDDVPNQDFSVD